LGADPAKEIELRWDHERTRLLTEGQLEQDDDSSIEEEEGYERPVQDNDPYEVVSQKEEPVRHTGDPSPSSMCEVPAQTGRQVEEADPVTVVEGLPEPGRLEITTIETVTAANEKPSVERVSIIVRNVVTVQETPQTETEVAPATEDRVETRAFMDWGMDFEVLVPGQKFVASQCESPVRIAPEMEEPRPVTVLSSSKDAVERNPSTKGLEVVTPGGSVGLNSDQTE
jgi:hypothetical protein